MARSKQTAMQPNSVEGANKLLPGLLHRDIARLKAAVARYEAEDASRKAAWAEYHRIEDKLNFSAEPAEYTSTDKLKIEWLYTHGEECRRARVTISTRSASPEMLSSSRVN